jgi:hypothetical protein
MLYYDPDPSSFFRLFHLSVFPSLCLCALVPFFSDYLFDMIMDTGGILLKILALPGPGNTDGVFTYSCGGKEY